MSEALPAVTLGDDVATRQDVTLVDDGAAHQDITLVDLLDRLLAGGVVITGDITLALADLDLVHVSLRLVVSSVPTLQAPSVREDADT